jgi:uncharacterized membrane protein YphA (DoxX/SURF4 family)
MGPRRRPATASRRWGCHWPSVVGPLVAYLELIGGAALILGLATRIIAATVWPWT